MFGSRSWQQIRGTAIVLAVGCAAPVRQSSGDSTAAAAAVEQRFDSLVAAIRRLDIDGMLAAYATDSTLTRAFDGRLLRGRAAVEQDFRSGFGAVRRIESLVIGQHALRVLSSTAVVLTVPLHEVFTDTTGARTTLRGTWTSVWSRGPEGWRIVQDAAVHVPEPNR